MRYIFVACLSLLLLAPAQAQGEKVKSQVGGRGATTKIKDAIAAPKSDRLLVDRVMFLANLETAPTLDAFFDALPTWAPREGDATLSPAVRRFAPPQNTPKPVGGSENAQEKEGNRTYNVTRERYSLATTPEAIVSFDPAAEFFWPGSLLQEKGLRGGLGSLNPIPNLESKRAPLRVFLVNPNVSNGSREVADPNGSSVGNAVGELRELLNGREMVSTGDNRGVEFDQYPSELLSGLVVYKTPDGTLIGQGLSGTIDLQTVRPLNFSQRTVSANVRREKSGVGTPFTGSGDRFNISYIDQFADRTIGVALGFARLKSSVQTARDEKYATDDDFSYNGSTIKVNHGFKLFNDSTSQTRDGAMAVFEFKPNKDFSSIVDLYYSKFDKDVISRGLEIQVADSWKNGNASVGYQAPALAPGAVVTGGKLISGT